MHILIIDDDKNDRFMVTREMRREFSDVEVEEVGEPEEFEQALAAGRFDLTITDYQLRWTNGLEILRTLKQRFPERPVIMFTNTGTQEIAVEAMKSGLDDYILKSPKHLVRLSTTVRSVLERNETRRRANFYENRLQSLLDQLNVGVFRVIPDGRLLEVNSVFLRVLGLNSLDELQSIGGFSEIFSKAGDITPQQRRERELKLRKPDGSSIWVSVNETLNTNQGESVIDGLVEDITGRKRAEESLKRYATRLRTLQELDRSILRAISPAGIAQAALAFTYPLLPCQLLDVMLFNLETQQATVLAVQSNEGIGCSIGESFSLQDFGDIETLQQNQALIIENLAEHPRLYRLQQRLFDQGIHFIMNVPVIAQGQLIGSLNVGAIQPRSLTDEDTDNAYEVANQLAIAIQQSRMREELHRYTEQLEELVSNRTQQLEEANSALEAFAYSISHDLQEPLRAMRGFATILLEEYDTALNSVGQDLLYRIASSVDRMDNLLVDLLAYSRLSRVDLPLQPINLNLLVRQVLTQLEPSLEEKQAQVTVAEPLLEVVGNYRTVEQIVTNLLTNSIKFVPAGVQPQVHVWSERRDASGALRERSVRLWVEDNGIGIQSQHYERIFGVFERLHSIEAYPGTGIGLAIVRKGIERMGGQVGMESEVGRGSRFWIELPEFIK
ncbi:ATP-binding protein [Dendronalium sp. ChiSLP03b]|uniref:ATP-binding protein n=1 Tax=Dendronalium sp. ChiSLP03b TaxID=3075381 RepID=UPI002AD52E50|nr:ATP-binding protein [Dendronalium sp. ChiSLP03b]MDZ8208988.1 ATP-binding protein [Dendronalium sp. ChiSLP03b]